MNQSKKTNNQAYSETRNKTKVLVYSGLLLALTTIFYVFFQFPVPFFAEFLRMDFSDTFALVGGITLGPVVGILLEILKNVLNLLINGSYSGGIGEMMNAIVGIAFILPIIFIYRTKKTNVRLVIGMIVGVIAMVIVAGVTNYYIALPVYLPEGTPASYWDMVVTVLTPFNLFKGTLVSIASGVVIVSLKGIFKYMNVNDQ
ncbi:MAG: ECF transporter S component [Vallitaleaceae bacterium]|jgi:riboflavin transporter FmnP|nr:ECF transporter S component [Vallitaleaceae bacterium]